MEKAVVVNHMTMNGRGAWHYRIDSDIGEIHLVQHEAPTMGLMDDYLGHNNNPKAETIFKKVCAKMIAGKL